jgi:homogentisate 1,2-dioxygenase
MGVFRQVKGVATRQGQAKIPEGTCEDQYSRNGFAGDQAMLYRKHSPMAWTRVEGDLKNRAADTNQMDVPDATDPRALPTRLMHNEDVSIYVSRRPAPMPYYFRNADGDELICVERGTGTIDTDFGPLGFKEGDYVVIPKGITYRLAPVTRDNMFYIVQTTGPIGFPERGVLGKFVPFDFAMLETPEPRAEVNEEPGEWEVLVKRAERFSSIFYPFDPMDVVGWQGEIAPFKLSIYDIRSISAERLDIPPSGLATFIAPGCWMCTFTPRPMQSDPDSTFVPPFHRNVDYDEVLFVLGSEGPNPRRHAGMMYFNPQGAHHGPQANPFAQTERPKRIDVYGLNIDTQQPLTIGDVYEKYEVSGR